jgi:protein-disulfide isomerase
MQNRPITLFIVVVIGIVLGVAVVNKQAKDPVMRELMEQQKTILKSHQDLEKKLGGDGSGETNLASIALKEKDLENRLTVMESEWRGFKMAMQRGAFGAGGAQPQAAAQQPPQEDYTTVYDLPVGTTPISGKKDAPVLITEFVDLQCPFCARFHPPMAEAVKAYPGKASYMLKNFPLSFHPNALPAAKAAFAAGEQGKYYEMVDLIFANHDNLSEDKYKELAKQLGLNEGKFWDDYKNKDAEWTKRIKEDMALGEKAGVRGTPTFFINGRKTMARDTEGYKKEIEAILNAPKQ